MKILASIIVTDADSIVITEKKGVIHMKVKASHANVFNTIQRTENVEAGNADIVDLGNYLCGSVCLPPF